VVEPPGMAKTEGFKGGGGRAPKTEGYKGGGG